MTNHSLAERMRNITEVTGYKVNSIAEKAGVNAANLYRIINREEYELEDTANSVLRKIKTAFPDWFDEETNKTKFSDERTSVQVSSEDDYDKDDQQQNFRNGSYQRDTKINSGKLDQSDRDLLLEILINQKATLQYLREIQLRLTPGEQSTAGKAAVSQVKETLRKGKLAGKDKQSKEP